MAKAEIRRLPQNQQDALDARYIDGKATDFFTQQLSEHVAPHLTRARRGKIRTIMDVGSGYIRGGIEGVALAVALGPAVVTLLENDSNQIMGLESVLNGVASVKNSMPDFLKQSTLQSSFGDLEAHQESLKYDVVTAFNITPELMANKGTGVKTGVDRIIDLAEENGGIVVFTNTSIGESEELQAALQGRMDIDIVEKVKLTGTPTGIRDEYLWVVKRKKLQNKKN